ncbi:hypothetical protein D910_07199, partial [Dendroctonus ponderosae]
SAAILGPKHENFLDKTGIFLTADTVDRRRLATRARAGVANKTPRRPGQPINTHIACDKLLCNSAPNSSDFPPQKPQNVLLPSCLLPACLLRPHLLPPRLLHAVLRPVRVRALLLPVPALLPLSPQVLTPEGHEGLRPDSLATKCHKNAK